ncbi:MAG: ABC transporter ATP-binding protein [Candidatus Omnitrophota bacterium]
MQKALLELQNVKKYFPIKRGFLKKTVGLVKAVDDVSLTIVKSRNLGLVGESGCGKTTLARLILKLITADAGRIIFNNQDIAALTDKQVRPLRKDLQIVFQDPYSSLDPRFTVREIIKEAFVFQKDRDKEKIEKRLQELLGLVMLPEDSLNRYPYEFSGGERQRIAIARSLVSNPQLLILDEAVSSLDVIVQTQILDLLTELQDKLNLTYLFVSHNLRVIKKICKQVAVMYLGNIVESADTEELFASPLHPYTEALLAAAVDLMPSLDSEVSSIIDLPSGCRFHPRCKYCQEKCRREEPILNELSPGHLVACHYPLKIK